MSYGRVVHERCAQGAILVVQEKAARGQVYLKRTTGPKGEPRLKIGKSQADKSTLAHKLELQLRHQLKRWADAGETTIYDLETIAYSRQHQLALEHMMFEMVNMHPAAYPVLEGDLPTPVFNGFVVAGTGAAGKSTLNRVGVLGLKSGSTPIPVDWTPPSLHELYEGRPWMMSKNVPISPRSTHKIGGKLLGQMVVAHLDSLIDFDQNFAFHHILATRPMLTEVNIIMSHMSTEYFDTSRKNLVCVLMPEFSYEELLSHVNKRSKKPQEVKERYARYGVSYQEREYPLLKSTFNRWEQLTAKNLEGQLNELREIIRKYGWKP